MYSSVDKRLSNIEEVVKSSTKANSAHSPVALSKLSDQELIAQMSKSISELPEGDPLIAELSEAIESLKANKEGESKDERETAQ
jgi:hypothetical protein